MSATRPRSALCELTRERDVALVLACVAPFEHGECLTDWECPRGIFERDDFILVLGKLGDVGVLFELEVGPKVGRKWREGECDVCIRRVGDLEVHIAFEFHRFDTALAQERDRDGFLDDDVYATEMRQDRPIRPDDRTCLSGVTDGRLPRASF